MTNFRTQVNQEPYDISVGETEDGVQIRVENYDGRIYCFDENLVPISLTYEEGNVSEYLSFGQNGEVTISTGSEDSPIKRTLKIGEPISSSTLEEFVEALDAVRNVANNPKFPKDIAAKLIDAYTKLGHEGKGIE